MQASFFKFILKNVRWFLWSLNQGIKVNNVSHNTKPENSGSQTSNTRTQNMKAESTQREGEISKNVRIY